MKLRRYYVTVMGAETRFRRSKHFWTLSGALRWRNSQRATSHTHMFRWHGGRWAEFS